MAKPILEDTRWAVTTGGVESTEVSNPDGDLKDDGYPASGDASIPLNTDWNWWHRKAHQWFQYLDALVDSSDAWTFPTDLTLAGPLTFTPKTFTREVGTGRATCTAHTLQTGDGPVVPSTTGTLPSGLTPGVAVWPIRIDANTLGVASTQSNALAKLADVQVGLAGAGTGTHTFTKASDAIAGSGTHGTGAGQSSALGSTARDVSVVGRVTADGVVSGCDLYHTSIQTIVLHPSAGQASASSPGATYDASTDRWNVAGTGNTKHPIPLRVGDSICRYRIFYHKASNASTTLSIFLAVFSVTGSASASIHGAGSADVLGIPDSTNAPGDVFAETSFATGSIGPVLSGGSWCVRVASSTGTAGDYWTHIEVDVIRAHG